VTTVADLERAAYDTWTADESIDMAGWTLFAADGFTRRVNCATAVGDPDTSPDVRAAISDWLTSRGAAPVVRVTPLVGRSTVNAVTSDLGYRSVDDTVVLTAPVRQGSETGAVRIVDVGSPEFFASLSGLNGRKASSEPAWRRLLERVAVRSAGLLIPGVAVGLVVASGRLAGVYSVAVAERERRQGHASDIMAAADRWAAGTGCDTLFLQVLGTNAPAIAMYANLGFTERYRYQYLEPVDGDPDDVIDGC
jgi:GNAT superfamily N-acetyltransferase